jgi:hypothetical protein
VRHTVQECAQRSVEASGDAVFDPAALVLAVYCYCGGRAQRYSEDKCHRS